MDYLRIIDYARFDRFPLMAVYAHFLGVNGKVWAYVDGIVSTMSLR